MWNIKANISRPHKYLRLNSKVVLSHYSYMPNPIEVRFRLYYSMSRGGRKLEDNWVGMKYLKNFRPDFAHKGKDKYTSIRVCRFENKEDCQKFCDTLNQWSKEIEEKSTVKNK